MTRNDATGWRLVCAWAASAAAAVLVSAAIVSGLHHHPGHARAVAAHRPVAAQLHVGTWPHCRYGVAHGSRGPQCSAPAPAKASPAKASPAVQPRTSRKAGGWRQMARAVPRWHGRIGYGRIWRRRGWRRRWF